jgi:hypothetical protein
MEDPNKQPPPRSGEGEEPVHKRVREIAEEKLVLLKKLRNNTDALAVLLSGLHPVILFALMRMAEKDRVFVANKKLWQKVAMEYFQRRTNKNLEYFENLLEESGFMPPYNYFHMILSHYCIYNFLYVNEATGTVFENFEQIETMTNKTGNRFESRPVVLYIKGYGREAFSITLRKHKTDNPILIVVRNNEWIPESSWGKMQRAIFHADMNGDIEWTNVIRCWNKSKSWKEFGRLFAALYRFLEISEDFFVAIPFNENTPEESLEKINKQALF